MFSILKFLYRAHISNSSNGAYQPK